VHSGVSLGKSPVAKLSSSNPDAEASRLHIAPGVTGHPLRVAIVAASLGILGGQAVQAQRLLRGWQNDRDVIAWLVPVNPVPPRPLKRLLQFKYVRTILTQLLYWPLLVRELRRADVVHVFSASYSSFALATIPAIVVAKVLSRPVLLNYHSGEAPDHLRRSRLARFVMRDCVDLNVVPSAFLREVLAGFGIDARVVTNTIDRRAFSFRERNPLRPRLLSTRNLEPMYNVACVLRAFARVQAHHPDAELTVVGFGSQETAMRQLAVDLGLRRVTFTGQVPPEDIARYYADADIYVQTPSIDNMPLSVLEAFASGLPVVSTSVGGVPAMLTHGVQGLLAPDDNDSAVAARVMSLLEAPDEARRLAAAAYESCVRYDWPVAREGWLSAYAAAAHRFPPTAAPASTASRERA
jgi:glycosyltransferase involved in cell wall biosynthesis